MLTILAALTFLAAANGPQASTEARTDQQASPILSVPLDEVRIFRLLDILSEDQRILVSYAIESSIADTESGNLTINKDGTGIMLSSEPDQPLFGYALGEDDDEISLSITYEGRSAGITQSSAELGPIEFIFTTDGQESTVQFDSVEQLDAAIELTLAVENGNRSTLALDRREQRLLSKASALKHFTLEFLGQK